MCSTPFGIIGILTQSRNTTRNVLISAQRLSASSEFSLGSSIPKQRPKHVLNAFRHHRNSHSIFAFVSLMPCSCAQRLSASSEFSQFPSIEGENQAHVLNAFRHHRNSHENELLK